VPFQDDRASVRGAEVVEDRGHGLRDFLGRRVAAGELVDRAGDQHVGFVAVDAFGQPVDAGTVE
jgi:hypothetical protein